MQKRAINILLLLQPVKNLQKTVAMFRACSAICRNKKIKNVEDFWVKQRAVGFKAVKNQVARFDSGQFGGWREGARGRTDTTRP